MNVDFGTRVDFGTHVDFGNKYTDQMYRYIFSFIDSIGLESCVGIGKCKVYFLKE